MANVSLAVNGKPRTADEVCGLGPSSSLPTGDWEHEQVTIERDGRVSATTGASPHGQGNETTFAQMLADQFGVPIEHITIHRGNTAVVKQGIGTFGSRSQAVGGTGEPTLLKLVAVDDAGNLINPLIVEGQIHGGLAQAPTEGTP